MHLFTSESVTEGHPDKVADSISDHILDAILEEDPHAHVAVETLIAPGIVTLAGETTSDTTDFTSLVKRCIKDIGYEEDYEVVSHIGSQSTDIAMGVNDATTDNSGDPLDSQGAGDQGLMFGYACSETPALMPLPIYLAHQLSARLTEVRKSGELDFLLPDGKSQVTIDYKSHGKPKSVDTVVIAAQHAESIGENDLRAAIRKHVINPVLAGVGAISAADCKVYINPTGRFVKGGPDADSGLTGRKIIVDTYGGMARHGGGAFSGKDPSKVDRSAAYAARWVAKNVVAAGLAETCEVQLSYAIGVAHPVSINVETFGTHSVAPDALTRVVESIFDLRPAAIIRDLDLLRPIYAETTNYGHFGRDGFSWENANRVSELLAAF